MEYTEESFIVVDKTKKKKVICHKIKCKPIKRELIIHADIDNKNITNVSDLITGYKLISIPIEPSKIQLQDIKENLEKFISHFTVEGITEEFKRIEELTTKDQK